MTVIYDRDLIAILKGANALAAQIIARHPELFGEQAQQPAPPPVAAAPVRVVGTDPGEVPMLPLASYGPQKRAS